MADPSKKPEPDLESAPPWVRYLEFDKDGLLIKDASLIKAFEEGLYSTRHGEKYRFKIYYKPPGVLAEEQPGKRDMTDTRPRGTVPINVMCPC